MAPEPTHARALVTGRVVDVDLAPVSGGEVRVRATNAHRTETVLVERAAVDDTGRFRLVQEAGLGRAKITYVGPAHFTEESPIDLYRGQFVELVAASLETVRVEVVDRTGSPVAGARVHGNLRAALGGAGDALTDEDGACNLTVGQGAMSIMACTDGGSYGVVAPVFVPGRDRVTVTVDRDLAEVRIQVVPAPGSEHLAGTRATLTSLHGTLVAIRRVDAIVGGPPVIVPLKHLELSRPAPTRPGSPASTRQVRIVGTIMAQVGDRPAYRARLRWEGLEKGRAGAVLVLPVEDMAHRVVLHLEDTKGNPVRGYAFRLARALARTKVEPRHLPLREIEARSDHAGTAVVQCAAGSYTGPFAGRLRIAGPLERSVVIDVTTAFGTATPGHGHVRVVPRGRESAEWSDFPKVPIEDGTWYANLEGVAPGTTLVAQWMDAFAPLASADVVAGGAPVHLEVEAVTAAPHETRLRVRDGGRLVWCEVKLDTQRAREPRVVRFFRGLRTFDLSAVPPGDYVAEVITRHQLQHHFEKPVHVGTGEVLELELNDADRVWDGRNGGWARK